jgi:hypothetical protein
VGGYLALMLLCLPAETLASAVPFTASLRT